MGERSAEAFFSRPGPGWACDGPTLHTPFEEHEPPPPGYGPDPTGEAVDQDEGSVAVVGLRTRGCLRRTDSFSVSGVRWGWHRRRAA